MEQRFTFDQVADLYDRARPGYPEALFDDVVAAAALSPGDPVLEIGCGTGKATLGLERRGLNILALDPGEALIAVARRRLAGFEAAQFARTTLEAWPAPPGAFRLAISAQALHWVAPDLWFAKPALTLAPGGVFAVFGSVPAPLPDPIRARVEDAYARHAPELLGPPPERIYRPGAVIHNRFEAAPEFGPVTHRDYRWSRPQTAESYPDFLRTLSTHQMLAPARRDALLGAVAEAIWASGGALEAPWETHLYWARRA